MSNPPVDKGEKGNIDTDFAFINSPNGSTSSDIVSGLDRLRDGARAVLVVDDNHVIAEIVARALDSRHISVATFSRCDEALKVFKQYSHLIPLVISDECMPGMGGREFLKEIHAIAPATKFVLMSGHYSDDLALPAVDGLFAIFLEKPFKVQRLFEVIERLIPLEALAEA